MIPSYLLTFLMGGLLGSIPFGLLVSKLFGKTDPRESGSSNIGATNVLRTGGWAPGLITLGGDVAKGTVAVSLLPLIFPAEGLYIPELAGISAVLGHMFSPFTGFRGGKGVATGLGVFAVLLPIPTLVAALVFIGLVGASRYVSLGSILGALSVPVVAALWGYPASTTAAAALISALIVWRHQENIQRLIRGEENRFGSKAS